MSDGLNQVENNEQIDYIVEPPPRKKNYKMLLLTAGAGLLLLLGAVFITTFSNFQKDSTDVRSQAAGRKPATTAQETKTEPPSGPVIQELVDTTSSKKLNRPWAITEEGVVVGSYVENSLATAAFFQDGVITSIGTLGGAYSDAFGANDGLYIVGDSRPTGAPLNVAYYWDGEQMTLLSPSSNYSSANDVNDEYIAAGFMRRPDNNVRAMSWDLKEGSENELGTLGGNFSMAHDINNTGTIVGVSSLNNNNINQRPFVYKNGQMTNIDPSGTVDARAIAINDLGVVVGKRGNTSFIWSENSGLRTINMDAVYDINNNGLVVGEVKDFSGPTTVTKAAVWVGDQVIVLNDWLGDSSWSLDTATAANDQNYIVGSGKYNGVATGYILRFSQNGP